MKKTNKPLRIVLSFIGFMMFSSLSIAGQPKTAICHIGDAGYELINIAVPAVPAHTAHGDLPPIFTTANNDPIWSNTDAQSKCPTRCTNEGGEWNGAWWTTVWGQHSVCQCNRC